MLTCFISESRVFISTIGKLAEFIIRHFAGEYWTMADIEIRQASPTAFYIKVHDTDNVAIIVNDNGLKAGTRFPDGLN
jgi:galactarate dehydratase